MARREDLGDLTAFVAVAEEQSFTRAAARLGVSQSALSHTARRLERRLPETVNSFGPAAS
jgi:DNA-binding transcriptional LysR family regulator